MTYNFKHSIPDIWIKRPFGKGLFKSMFKWYEVGILGCGLESRPWIDLENKIQWPDNLDDIANEIRRELDLVGHRPGGGTCLLPKSLNGYQFITYYQYFYDRYIPNDIWKSFQNPQSYDSWVAEHFSKPVWECALIAKKQPNPSDYWSKKHMPGATWQCNLQLTQEWIDSLETYLFKHIGRVIIYRGKTDQGVPIHRDFPITEHSAHFVNFQITSTNRKAFVYDEVTDEKIYTLSRAYMFNESDCHGVEADGEDHFTIRVDGEFRDDISKDLNLIDGNVFSLNSKNYYKLKNLKVIDPVYDYDKQ